MDHAPAHIVRSVSKSSFQEMAVCAVILTTVPAQTNLIPFKTRGECNVRDIALKAYVSTMSVADTPAADQNYA